MLVLVVSMTGLSSIAAMRVVRRPAVARMDFAQTGGSPLGTRCKSGAAEVDEPALLGETKTARSARVAEILRGLWRCGTPAGVRAVGGPVAVAIPESLQQAVGSSPAEAEKLLTWAPASLPVATVNWGSGGNQVAMVQNETAAFLTLLFDHIESAGLSIEVSRQDLFHGHVFALPPKHAGSGELGILFHAKEYPEDLYEPKGVDSGFTCDSPGYADRNLLYLASTNRIYVIDPVDASGKNHCLLSNLEIKDWLPAWCAPERVRTFDTSALYEVGALAKLPDVNILRAEITSGPRVLFAKGYN